mgnify:CR=1 FL=1
MKKITTETKKILNFNWKKRLEFLAKGDKLRAEGSKFHAESSKFHAEGSKLWAKGDKLHAEGDKLWAETILEFCGNIKLEWIYIKNKDDYSCKLENGEIFNP